MKKGIYKCSDYNGYKDVLFLMSHTDAEFSNGIGVSEYTLTSNVVSLKKKVATTEAGDQFSVFADGSVKLVGAA